MYAALNKILACCLSENAPESENNMKSPDQATQATVRWVLEVQADHLIDSKHDAID